MKKKNEELRVRGTMQTEVKVMNPPGQVCMKVVSGWMKNIGKPPQKWSAAASRESDRLF